MKEKYLTPIAIVIAGFIVAGAIIVGGRRGEVEKQKEGEKEVEEGQVAGEEKREYPETIGNFLITKEDICQEEEKPIVYYFGSSRCPHCTWEHPIIKKVMEEFSDDLSFHDLMDDQSGKDMEVFQKYMDINQGAIPFLVFGCKYVRVGSGEELGEAEEERALTALACKLTEGKPSSVCEAVKDLVGQVE